MQHLIAAAGNMRSVEQQDEATLLTADPVFLIGPPANCFEMRAVGPASDIAHLPSVVGLNFFVHMYGEIEIHNWIYRDTVNELQPIWNMPGVTGMREKFSSTH